MLFSAKGYFMVNTYNILNENEMNVHQEEVNVKPDAMHKDILKILGL